jgi:nucleotide-binding universal stress UspA family protein
LVHILVATDGSKSAINIAREAGQLLASLQRVTLLTVLTRVPEVEFDELDEPLVSPQEQSRQWDALIGEATSGMAHLATVFAEGVKVDARVEAGEPARTISQVAREVDANVIVVGDRMQSRLHRLAHRSVADRLIREASCAVLVIPEP